MEHQYLWQELRKYDYIEETYGGPMPSTDDCYFYQIEQGDIDIFPMWTQAYPAYELLGSQLGRCPLPL